jgi:hypothetical protein
VEGVRRLEARFRHRGDDEAFSAWPVRRRSGSLCRPYPRFRAGVRRFPAIMPVDPASRRDHSLRASRFFREAWSGRTFMAIGVQDLCSASR